MTYSMKFTSGLLAVVLATFSIQPGLAATAYQQPTISNFSPTSGAGRS